MVDEKAQKLEEARRVIRQAIDEKRSKYEEVANDDEADAVLLEGITSTGHYCQMMVSSQIIAKIYLKYNYAEDMIISGVANKTMWEEIADTFGVKEVESVDF